jgi:dUTP pyrophosphatase
MSITWTAIRTTWRLLHTAFFGEAGMTLPPAKRTPAMIALQQAGYSKMPEGDPVQLANKNPLINHLLVQRLTPNAHLPRRANDGSVGYDLYSTQACELLPKQWWCITLDIAVTPPPGIYVQIASRSGLAVKQRIDVAAGVVDPNYTGNIQVVLHNHGDTPFHISPGDRIAQMIILPYHQPNIQETNQQDVPTQGIFQPSSAGAGDGTVSFSDHVVVGSRIDDAAAHKEAIEAADVLTHPSLLQLWSKLETMEVTKKMTKFNNAFVQKYNELLIYYQKFGNAKVLQSRNQQQHGHWQKQFHHQHLLN